MAAERESCPPRRRESSQSSCCCERARETAMSGAVGGAMGGGGDCPTLPVLAGFSAKVARTRQGGLWFRRGPKGSPPPRHASHRLASPRVASRRPAAPTTGAPTWGPTTPPLSCLAHWWAVPPSLSFPLMSPLDSITIGGVEYVRTDKQRPIGTRAVVVIDRGWIYAGDVTRENGRIYLSVHGHGDGYGYGDGNGDGDGDGDGYGIPSPHRGRRP